MSPYQGASGYRNAAAEGATQIGLLIIAYDALAREFSRAGDAVRRNDIVARCKHSNLALTLLGHLENWNGYLEDSSLETSLQQFYGVLRGRTLQLQAQGSSEEFDALAKIVVDTRAAWQQKEHQLSGSAPSQAKVASARVLSDDRGQGSSSFQCSV